MTAAERVHSFTSALVDAQVTYIEAERRVSEVEEQNTALRKLVFDMLNSDMDQYWPEMTRRAKELGIEVGP